MSDPCWAQSVAEAGQRWLAGGLCGLGIWLASSLGCDWRKPLPHRPDAGPPVQLVDTQGKAAGPGSPSASGTVRAPSLHSSSLFLVEEHEPNDDPEQAQPVASGRGVRGSLAPPTSLGAGKGADDFYVLAAAATGGVQLLGLTLTTGPLVDVQLTLYSSAMPGQRPVLGKQTPQWHVDERGPGQGERVSGLAVRPGQIVLVRVRGALTPPKAGELPTGAAASLDYQLSVTQTAAPMGSEVEPNDTYETACVADSSDLSGTLLGRGDEDFFSLNLVDSLYHRGQPGTDPGQAGFGHRGVPGLKTDAILRVEVRSPGVTPALRIWVEPEASPAAPASSLDGGSHTAAAAGTGVQFGKLRFLGDFVAGKGQSELRLRNLPLVRGSARAFVSVRAVGASLGSGNKDVGTVRPSAGDSRYSVRLSVEPSLEGAESEPNDDCEQANLVPLASRGSAAGSTGIVLDGQLAGFLWPGDVDCFRIPYKPESSPAVSGPAPSVRTWTVKLAVPGAGADCDASLDAVKGPTTEVVPGSTPDGAGSAGKTLVLRAKADAWVRISSRDRGCGQAPYVLSVSGPAGAAP